MENSRRPFDRSRDPGPLKKPRLTDEPVRGLNPNGRPFPAQRPAGSVTTAPGPRFRATVRETEDNNDPSREAYQPQPINPHHELVDQYKSALSELTFNSKPMITNLTIIAGESLQAAKAIAATVCNNILEVPSEQKLPSLYLLDSIVKNIGRDYIKHFAPRLPEVFVKAFRQVDPSTRSSMRHLFGTWKGVFHPQTLQIIDKELEFTSKNDGSSSAVATSRNDSQPQQRQAHGIHVNPKYLERQRLQQSARAKGMVDDVPGLIANSDSDRLERTPAGPTRAAWIDPPVKLNRIRGSQRDATSEPFYEKDISAALGDIEYGSGTSLGINKISGRIAEEGHEEPWFGTRSTVPEISSGQRDLLSTKNRISRGAVGISNSWKNSEEEEFMWDMHSRVSVLDVANNTLNIKNDVWAPDELEKLDSDDLLLRQPRIQDAGSVFDSETSNDMYSSEPKDGTVYGQWTSTSRPLQDDSVRPGFSTWKEEKHPSTVGGLPSVKPGSTISRKGNQPQVASSRVGSSGSRILPNSASGSVRQTPISHSVSLQNSAKQDVRRSNSLPHRDPRAAQFSGKPPGLSVTAESPSRTENGSGLSNPLASEVSGQSDVNRLLAAVVKTGIISNNLAGGGAKDENVEDEEKQMPQSHAKHFLPSSGPRASLTPSSSQESKSARVKVAQKSSSGCPQSSISVTTSSKTSDAKNKALDPISNLLNSLVSKGLISASKSEAPSLLQPQMASEVSSQSPDNSSKSSSSDSAVPSDVQPTPQVDKVPAAKTEEFTVPSEPTKTEVENLIGYEFRPNIVREFHPSVISSLFDELPHQCNVCGIHLKLKEQLDRHLELHSKEKHDSTSTDKPSWGWYAKADDWVAGDMGFFEPEPAFFGEPESRTEDGPIVSADESQYACILCGELFEDYFCQEKDQWMFKGAVYMTIPPANAEDEEGPIVHAACLTESSMHDLGFGSIIKQEKDD